jgi:hypothetical protein
MEAFEGVKYRALVTTDTSVQVKSFYEDTAKKIGFDFVGTESFSYYNSVNFSGATCFSKEITALMLSSKVPALAVRVLSWDNAPEAKFIAQYFPQTPPKMNVILLFQGYKNRTLA